MRRHVSPLDPADVGLLLGGCGACTRWSLDPVRRAGGPAPHAQRAWVADVTEAWGPCGLLLRLGEPDGAVAGHVLYAPAALAPGSAGHPTSPASPDAVVLLGLRVASAYAGQGLGRHLVQAMARDLVERGVPAVEAFADTGAHPGRCLLPADFLGACGFAVHRAHARTPRMRMDLTTTLPLREQVGAAVGRLIRPRPRPAAPELGRARREPAASR